MSKRRKYADGELDQLQRFKHENQRLKRDNARLKKQLDRVDIDRFQNLKDVIEAQEKADKREAEAQDEVKLKKEWGCWDCKEGVLRLQVFERRDGVFYFRKCDHCTKRTALKPYNNKVKGVKEDA